MFTGLIDAVGVVAAARQRHNGLRLTVRSRYRGVALGESIAVDGACLTVIRRGRGSFTVQVVATSLDRTRFADTHVGDRVNLERALRVGDRLGGHLVQGHVDGVGTVRSVTRRKDAVVVDLRVPAEVASVSVPLGSITVDGVSLTIVAKPARNTVRLSLIPFTLQHTTLSRLRRGSTVHVEGDLIGKYVQAMATGGGRRAKRSRPRRP
jgi:riboflavin synthase